jgi:hypothetical protein
VIRDEEVKEKSLELPKLLVPAEQTLDTLVGDTTVNVSIIEKHEMANEGILRATITTKAGGAVLSSTPRGPNLAATKPVI